MNSDQILVLETSFSLNIYIYIYIYTTAEKNAKAALHEDSGQKAKKARSERAFALNAKMAEAREIPQPAQALQPPPPQEPAAAPLQSLPTVSHPVGQLSIFGRW